VAQHYLAIDVTIYETCPLSITFAKLFFLLHRRKVAGMRATDNIHVAVAAL